MNQMVSFGERLKEERLSLELSQTAFGSVAGVTKKSQMLYEAGERSPDGVYLAAIASAGADVLYILTGQRGAAPAPALSRDEAALLDNYRHCPPEGRACIKATSAALAQSKGVKKGRAA